MRVNSKSPRYTETNLESTIEENNHDYATKILFLRENQKNRMLLQYQYDLETRLQKSLCPRQMEGCCEKIDLIVKF